MPENIIKRRQPLNEGWTYANSGKPLALNNKAKEHNPLALLEKADQIAVDKLTGCLGQNQYHKFINEYIPRHDGVVIFLDVNKFKSINDIYGHDFANKCLAEIGKKLNKMFRANYDRIFRSGGDEFVIFCENYDAVNDFIKVIENKINSLEIQIYTDDGELVEVQLAKGIQEYRKSDSEVVDVKHTINLADKNMYMDKRKGSNIF